MLTSLALLEAIMIYIIPPKNRDIYNMINDTSKKCHHLIVWTTAIPILEENVAGMVRIAKNNEKKQLHMAVLGELTPESTFDSIKNITIYDSRKLDASYVMTELLARSQAAFSKFNTQFLQEKFPHDFGNSYLYDI